MNRLLLLLILSLYFGSCVIPEEQINGNYTEGIFVVNEGVFGQTSGTVTHINKDNNSVTQKIFRKVNNRDLGDVVQSMSFHNNLAYIVVNNSNKIEVADANSFEEKAQITGLKLPRYFVAVSDSKAYVSEWGLDGLSGQISVIDLTNNTVSSTITVGTGPEQMHLKGDKLYISHIGGYSDNNIISVIDINTDLVETTFTAADRPGGIIEDLNENLWVACSGKIVYSNYPLIDSAASSESLLIRISSNHIIDTIQYFGKGNPVSLLNINKNNNLLYFYKNNKVIEYNIATEQERELFSGNFYGLNYNEADNYIYTTTSSGIDAAWGKRYSSDGAIVDSFQVGVFSNGYIFK